MLSALLLLTLPPILKVLGSSPEGVTVTQKCGDGDDVSSRRCEHISFPSLLSVKAPRYTHTKKMQNTAEQIAYKARAMTYVHSEGSVIELSG